MRVAMITGGQPRFKKYWTENYKRMIGATEIDLYFYLWNDYILTDSQLNFSDVEGTLEEKIISVLPNNVHLKKFTMVEEPKFEDIITPEFISKFINVNHLENDERVKKSLTGTFSQRYSLLKAFEMVDKEYDCVIRYRVDCYPDRKINLNEYDLNSIVIPYNMRHDYLRVTPPFNDKFAIGNMENMHTYSDAYNQLVTNLFEEPKTIQEETGLCYHLLKNDVNFTVGEFDYLIVNEERGFGGPKMHKKN
jgi:hypothetical protein